MIQGAYITPEQYAPLGAAIQAASVYTLWVGIPELPLDLAEPLALPTAISRVLKSMTEQGMNASAVFYSGHSLGGAMVQDYVYKNGDSSQGQILMGAYLLRKYRNQTYPVPTLTVGGELDGLTRVTRIMEEYYHRIFVAKDFQAATRSFPVAVIEGMSHFQFASGNIPSHVKNNDLKPEISYDTAHALVASLVSAFLALQMGDVRGLSTIQTAVEATGSLVKPLINAYQLEGFYNFLPPCYDKKPSPYCTVGCPWTEKGQQIMGGLPQGPSLIDKDAFHPVWQSCQFIFHMSLTIVLTLIQVVYSILSQLAKMFTRILINLIPHQLTLLQRKFVPSLSLGKQYCKQLVLKTFCLMFLMLHQFARRSINKLMIGLKQMPAARLTNDM